MRGYRDIATLAGTQILCFLLLTRLEPNFFLIHLYQSILYIAILVMLFYTEDRWAYMIGMLASFVWLGMAYSTGILGSAVRQMGVLQSGTATANAVGFIALLTALIAVLMIFFSGWHWRKVYSGQGKGRGTFLVSLGIVAAYYAILIAFFWEMIPNA
jgi:hypothetical protein